MWNKDFRILWFKLQIDDHSHFGLPFPIPLYIFQELLDCTLDLLIVVSLLVPQSTQKLTSPSYSIYAAKELLEMTIKLLNSLSQDEPYDLVDVRANKVRVFIKIR